MDANVMDASVHCPISKCTTSPGYCTSELSTDEWAIISIIIIATMLVVVLSPYLAGGDVRCWKRNDLDLHSTFVIDSRRASMAGFRVPSREHTDIEPPMYLCGIGLFPLPCGTTGLLVIIFVMVAGFLTTFLALLNSKVPCATGVGRCRTISCVCGNALNGAGYVFMFGCLVITAILLVQKISAMFHHHRLQHQVLKPLLILGALLLTLTGLFPEKVNLIPL